MKKKLIFPTLIILFFCSMMFYYRGIRRQTEAVLGPVSPSLSGFRKWDTILKCSKRLDEFHTAGSTRRDRLILTIEEGDSAAYLADKLVESGMIPDAELFLLYLVYSGNEAFLQPGSFSLTPGMTVPKIADTLARSGGKLIEFAFLSGMRLEEIAALIPTSGLSFSAEDFLYAATHYPASKHPTGGTSLEGYLLPGSYQMERSISLDDFLAGFVNEFNRRVKPLENSFLINGLTLEEGVILASMIQKEAMDPAEYTTIASVFCNRLRTQMKLESDPTVQYAVGYDQESQSWWKTALTMEDLAINSSYNTYEAEGLPPAPICCPGLDVLKAASMPAYTPYFYFRAKCDGTPQHNFSETLAEHIAYACE